VLDLDFFAESLDFESAGHLVHGGPHDDFAHLLELFVCDELLFSELEPPDWLRLICRAGDLLDRPRPYVPEGAIQRFGVCSRVARQFLAHDILLKSWAQQI
jgi:hypothetical protein